jgi:hypothetical protein
LISLLRENNHLYSILSDNEIVPQPVILEENPTVNNTDTSGDAYFHPMMSLRVI